MNLNDPLSPKHYSPHLFSFQTEKQEKTIKWKKDITGKWTIINQSLINYTQLGDSMGNLLQKNQKSSFPRKLGQRLALLE